MTKQVDFIFDFASPNAYLVHKMLPDFAAKNKASFNYIPCLLGGIFKSTNNQPPMLAFGDIPKKMAYESAVMARWTQRYGLNDFKMNPHFPINTVALMRCAIVAQTRDELPAFIDAMLVPMWEAGADLGDPAIIAQELDKAGFDAPHYMETITTDPIKQKLIENTAAAVERGCFGIPTFYYDGHQFFGKDHLAELEYHLNK